MRAIHHRVLSGRFRLIFFFIVAVHSFHLVWTFGCQWVMLLALIGVDYTIIYVFYIKKEEEEEENHHNVVTKTELPTRKLIFLTDSIRISFKQQESV